LIIGERAIKFILNYLIDWMDFDAFICAESEIDRKIL
jgi:hypothetical protein